MKIAYISFEKPGAESGVGKKIRAQSETWRRYGHVVTNFVLSNAPPAPADAATQHIGCTYARHPYVLGAMTVFHLHKQLERLKPDIVYSRQMLWWPLLVWSLGKAPLVLEINSKDLAEYRRGNRLKYLLHYLTRGFLLKAAAGIVSVTREIERYMPDYSYEKIVIGNGYDFGEVQPRPLPQNKRPQLVFVGSPGQPWHGVDKLVRLAAQCPGYDFNVVVPGLHIDGVPNLKCHGGLYGPQLTALYQEMDVAVGTLALHRNDMSEATPLKTREYLAHGIPVFAGYDDTDLIGCDYFLNIGNFEQNVEREVQQITDFVAYWISRDIPRDDVVKRLSNDVKERKRLDFMERIVARCC